MTDDLPPQVQKLLNTRVKLDNGELAEAIVLDYSSIHPGGRFYCNVCCAMLGSATNLLQHTKGKAHAKAMAPDVIPAAIFGTRRAGDSKSTWDMNKPEAAAPTVPAKLTSGSGAKLVDLAPGEPVPPGFEDVVQQLPEICDRLQLMKAPLLGLEFLAEVTQLEEFDEEPRYVCMLCDKKGDKRTVLAHLVSFNHRIRYISRFFPRTIRALEAIPKLKEYRRGTGEVLRKIAKGIEDKFGRLVPVIIGSADFEAMKEDLFGTMMQGNHHIETPDCKYETIVDMDFIKSTALHDSKLPIDVEAEEAKILSASVRTGFKHLPIGETENDAKKGIAEPAPTKDSKPQDKKAEKNGPTVAKRRREKSASLSSLSSISRSRSRSGSRSRTASRRRDSPPSRRRAVLPYRRTRSRSRSRSIGRRRRASPSRRSPRRLSPIRRRSPSRRSPVRRSPGRRSPYRRPPPAKSWAPVRPVVSFKVKQTPTLAVQELEEERERKDKLRQFRTYAKALHDEMAQKLKTYEKTPEKHPQYSEEWKKFWNKRYKELTAEGKDASKHDFKPEWIKFWTIRIKELNDEELKSRLKTFRSELGLPEALSDSDDDEIIDVTPITDGKAKDKKQQLKEEEEVTVLHVLRLMAALEDQLASLGPRVNNLLSQALSLDKIRSGASETLLDNVDNVVLFETVKEKLKGQLFAGVVEKHMVKGTKKAISAAVELFCKHEQRKKEVAAAAAAAGPAATPLVVPGVGAVDKMAIAAQIASALVAQGKTDLSEDDLEQLINAVVGMAQVSHAVAQAGIGPTPGPEPGNEDNSSLQNLLSSVVQAHTGKMNSSLQLLQSYEEDASSPKGITMKEMSQLSDHDLKTLLQNFRGLSREEQQFLISYLKELEAKDAASVAKLRSFINIEESPPGREISEASGRLSPFSSREGGANPTSDKPSIKSFEDDEDDYSYEEIFRAAKKNVKKDQAARKAAGKDMVQKMIEDQERKVAETKTPLISSSKPSVVIDPNDLFNGITAAATAAVSTAAPTTQSIVKTLSSTASATYPSDNTSPQTVMPVTSMDPLPSSSLGPRMSAAPLDPAPQPMTEPPPPAAWDGYSYPDQQPNYSYQQNTGYNYPQEQIPHYQDQEYGNTWSDQGYQQQDPYAGSNGYNYGPPESSYEAPPQDYTIQPPPYQSYY